MNIEYVYLILLGISNFMESTSYHQHEDTIDNLNDTNGQGTKKKRQQNEL